MLNVFIFMLLMTCTLALNKNNEINDLNLQYRDNVIFQEITTISTSHSHIQAIRIYSYVYRI